MDVRTIRNITLNVKGINRLPIYNVVQNDSNLFVFNLVDGKNNVNLESITQVIVNFRRPDGMIINRSVEAEGNVVNYKIGYTEMEKTGLCELTIQFFDGEERLTTRPIYLQVISSPDPSKDLDNPDESTLVQQIFSLIKRLSETGVSGLERILSKETLGRYEDAVVLAAIANESNPRPQVLGVRSSQHASSYGDRDGVAFYSSIRSRKPTVVVNTGTIIYTENTVQVTGSTVVNLNKIEPGMLIDTYHEPNRHSALIESVDVENQIITVVDGWYMVQKGGSTTTNVPESGIGFDINRVTKIFGINNNVFLYPDDPTEQGIAAEFGIFNHSGKASGGLDIINYAKKSSYGYQVRKTDTVPDAEGFTNGYVASDCDVGFLNKAHSPSQVLVQSLLNGSAIDGFTITGGGTQNKLKLVNSLITDGITSSPDPNARIFIINKTIVEDFNLPSSNGKNGELLFVLNCSNIPVTLKVTDNGARLLNNGSSGSITSLQPKTSAIFVSDGVHWHMMNLSVNNTLKGTNAPTTIPQYVGQDFMDIENKKMYKAFGISSAEDWVMVN